MVGEDMFRDKLQRFMLGRYGSDNCNRFLLIVALALLVLSMLLRNQLLSLLAWVLVLLAWFRMFSRNIARRRQENLLYLRYHEQVRRYLAYQRSRWRDRKTHRDFSCPRCHAHLRVPKGRGRISIRCNRCGHEFERKT